MLFGKKLLGPANRLSLSTLIIVDEQVQLRLLAAIAHGDTAERIDAPDPQPQPSRSLKALAKELAVHIAAAKPLAVRIEDLPADVVQRERAVYEKQVAEQKKPANIREKIVDGMMKKFYEENVLLEQKYVRDDKRTVGELVKELSSKTGENVQVRRFVRFELGGS